MKSKLFNIIGFQSCWWACVLGVVNDLQYLGPILMSVFLLIHLLFFKKNNKEIHLILGVGLFGVLVDTIFLNLNIVEYEYPISNLIAPLWIIYMWLGFASTINHSLYWLNNNYIIMFFSGLIFGPLSYIAGLEFGALNFEKSFFVFVIIGFSWAIIMPIIFYFNKKYVRF
tara:strand:+ start:179 stop:688 length:510 start_codon:yes stop_codon:yes gene_type:complete